MAGSIKQMKPRWSSFLAPVLLLGFGGWMVHTGSAERTIAAAPRITPSTMHEYAGTGIPVLLEARAVAIPPLMTPAGEELALQRLTLTHESGSGDDRETVTDYDVLLPGEIWASEAGAVVRVVTTGADPRFIPEIASNRTARGGSLPPGVAARVGAGFRDLPTRSNLDLSVRAIPNREPVVVYGIVEIKEGSPLIGAPGGGRPFVITSLNVESLIHQTGSTGMFLSRAGWACAAFGIILGVAVVRHPGRALPPGTA
ncbi:hypothetical protein BH23GEM3_BH23GEM3_08720 [soil metagenome]